MINISYISTHTDAFSVIMIQLPSFIYCFPSFQYLFSSLPGSATSDRTYSELYSVYIFTYIYLVCVFLSVCVCVAWGGVGVSFFLSVSVCVCVLHWVG